MRRLSGESRGTEPPFSARCYSNDLVEPSERRITFDHGIVGEHFVAAPVGLTVVAAASRPRSATFILDDTQIFADHCRHPTPAQRPLSSHPSATRITHCKGRGALWDGRPGSVTPVLPVATFGGPGVRCRSFLIGTDTQLPNLLWRSPACKRGAWEPIEVVHAGQRLPTVI